MTDRSETTLHLVRVMPHSRERVFNAFMDPQIYRQWTAPGNFEVTDVVVDPETGRGQRYTMVDLDSGSNYIWDVVFKDVIENERIQWVSIWVEGFFDKRETVATIEFKDVNGGTEITLVHELFPNSDVRDNHGQGWSLSFDTLEKFLTEI